MKPAKKVSPPAATNSVTAIYTLMLANRLHRAEQIVADLWRQAAYSAGLGAMTLRQAAVIEFISGFSDAASPPSQTDIVDRSDVDRSTLADVIRRLEKSGHIERRRTKHDARAYAIKLTALGQRDRAKISAALMAMDASLHARITGLDGLGIIEAETIKSPPAASTTTSTKPSRQRAPQTSEREAVR